MPENTLRFAWWGAEESGLIGSNEYVFNPDFGLTDEEYEALAPVPQLRHGRLAELHLRRLRR